MSTPPTQTQSGPQLLCLGCCSLSVGRSLLTCISSASCRQAQFDHRVPTPHLEPSLAQAGLLGGREVIGIILGMNKGPWPQGLATSWTSGGWRKLSTLLL